MSRRSFVLASGSALGASVVGLGRGTANGATAVTVTASEPYRPVVSEIAAGGRSGDGPTVDVRSPDSDPIAAVTDGEVDVHVSGRPQVVAADGTVRSTARTAVVVGRGTLAHERSGWCECVGAAELTEQATDGDPVETWSETDWRTFDAVERARASAEAGRPVVRGTRSFQYAHGRGGVAYYSVDRDSLHAGSGGAAAGTDRRTPLVRLGYAHVDRSAAGDRPASVERLVGERPGLATDDASYFPDPGVRATD